MGRITSESQKETPTTTVTHFSHPHPLQQQETLNFSSSCCSGCSHEISGTFYSCPTCNFFLHKQCFDMPKKITHPFHKEHTLTLLPKPAYATGIFNCDACFEKGKGFSYSCDTCGIDLHILCAIMPLSVPNSCHPHKLDLTFGSPYAKKKFACDVCKKLGGDHWLYRCGPCGFDAHLNCARPQNHAGFRPQVQAGTTSRSVHLPQPQPVQQNFVHHPAMNMYTNPHHVPLGYPAGGSMMAQSEVDRQNQLLLLQAIQQLIQNNNAMTQAMLSSGYGVGVGVGVGGDRGVQQLMRMMSGLNNGGGDILQMLMSGGGVGGGLDMNMIQSLFGGNGLDFLGGGGFDFLGALGGFF